MQKTKIRSFKAEFREYVLNLPKIILAEFGKLARDILSGLASIVIPQKPKPETKLKAMEKELSDLKDDLIQVMLAELENHHLRKEVGRLKKELRSRSS